MDLFFILRNHPEWQRECGYTPQDPMVLALEKEQGNKELNRCCSACSIGKRCLKYGSEEDDVD